eukprot:jgi/Mesen1/116/ME1124141C07615
MRFSGYRVGARQLAGVGIGTASMRSNASVDCRWVGRGGELHGNAEVIFPKEHQDVQYAVLLLHCTFSEDVPPDGGYMVAALAAQDFVLYRCALARAEHGHSHPPSMSIASGELTLCTATGLAPGCVQLANAVDAAPSVDCLSLAAAAPSRQLEQFACLMWSRWSCWGCSKSCCCCCLGDFVLV